MLSYQLSPYYCTFPFMNLQIFKVSALGFYVFAALRGRNLILIFPNSIYLFKAKNRNTRKRCEKLWNIFKLNIKNTRTTSIVNFEKVNASWAVSNQVIFDNRTISHISIRNYSFSLLLSRQLLICEINSLTGTEFLNN